MARAPVVQDVEAVPEADRLDGFAHPRDTERLIGHESAEQRFAETFAQERVHHAWLIGGREGIGKATFAYKLAQYVLAELAERGCGGEGALAVPATSVAARQVRALSHPGLMVIRRAWDSKAKRFLSAITVDDVRRLKGFLAHSTGQNAWRVVIVDQADELNINAANALLKSLEEPPPRALFVLISSEPGRLLTTIRSRCRRFDLGPLEAGSLRAAAVQAIAGAGREEPAAGDWDRLIVLAQGSVRRLLGLTGADGLKQYERVEAVLAMLPKVDWTAVHALADDTTGSGAEQRFEQAFDLLIERLSVLIRARATGTGREADIALASRLIGAHGLATWAELWETTLTRKNETLALNLDRKTLILETVARMQTAARG